MISSSKDPHGFFGKLQRLKPQQTALAGGFFFMLNSGMQIGHGFFCWEDVNVPWAKSDSTMIGLAAAAWFMGGILGFVLVPTTIRLLNKQLIYVSTSKIDKDKKIIDLF